MDSDGAVEPSPQCWRAVDRSIAAFERLPARFLEAPAANGWPRKVHIAHLADWNLACAALLEGRNPAEVMGIPARRWRTAAEADINAWLAALAIDLSPAECIRRYRESCARLRAVLQRGVRSPAIPFRPGDPALLSPAGREAQFSQSHLLDHLEELLPDPRDRRREIPRAARRGPPAIA
ncbi:DinB family protein [Tepidiforma flava]|uniref:DinB family protein n=1 Tax=Tepidiforma flava TaxID=3004094 RepID=A0ABY7M5E1_9CHLR|nr:DinB family protein [Tepidiforma flava]WBL35367.1 DinB family protein [Tepidiforma flava]